MGKKLSKNIDSKKIYKILMKVKGQIDSIEVNFVIDIPKSLFLYQKDKDLVSKISRKIKETNLDIAELMYRLRGDLFDFEKHYESIKDVSITYICFQCKLHNKDKLCQRCGSVKGFTTVEHIICPNCNESTHNIIGDKMMKFCSKCGFIINDIRDNLGHHKRLEVNKNGYETGF
jgi:ribosomal protein L37E